MESRKYVQESLGNFHFAFSIGGQDTRSASGVSIPRMMIHPVAFEWPTEVLTCP